MIARVDYVILYVGDLERSIAFYREVAGLQLKFHDRGYAEFVTAGGTKFGLFERAKLPELIGWVARAGGPGGEVAFLAAPGTVCRSWLVKATECRQPQGPLEQSFRC